MILPPDGVLRSRPLGTGPRDRPAPAAVAPGVASDVAALAAIVDTLDVAPPFDGGSNNWVVAGSRSITGKPLLANDPHLAGQAPAVWYLAHVSGGTLDAIGATLPGVPGVMIGRNQRIAWGITALLGDVQDLYVEKVNTRDQAEFNGALEPVRIVRETIKVRGGPDVPLRVRITRHGPIISDVLEHPQSTLALRWTGLDAEDATAECFVRVNLAGSWLAVHRRAAPHEGAAAQFRLRGHRRQHRLLRPWRVPGARGRRRHAPGAGLDRRIRMARVPARERVAVRLQPAARLHRVGQQQGGAGLVPVHARHRAGKPPTGPRASSR